jgi:hypothetical protein
MIAAMKSDNTRVMTYRQPVETLLQSIGVKITPHGMSHYISSKGEHLDGSERRDKAQSHPLAHLLKTTKEADGSSLFDHCTGVYGSNIRKGHLLNNCPTVVSGRGAGIQLEKNSSFPKTRPSATCGSRCCSAAESKSTNTATAPARSNPPSPERPYPSQSLRPYSLYPRSPR